MGQEEVIDYLKKCKEPKTRSEIAEELSENPNKISVILAKLMKWEEVKCIEINHEEAREKYGAFRRMNLYYV